MDTATEIQSPTSETTDNAADGAQQESGQTLSDGLSDPLLADGGDAEAVQMILPPKPGKGPQADDAFRSVDEILAAEG